MIAMISMLVILSVYHTGLSVAARFAACAAADMTRREARSDYHLQLHETLGFAVKLKTVVTTPIAHRNLALELISR